MLTTALRQIAVVLVSAFVFVVNPAWVAGCVSSTEDDPARVARAKTTLLAALDDVNGEGSWAFTFDGEQYELLLELSQSTGEDTSARVSEPAPLVAVAHACGTHTFYQAASACDTVYQLAIEGTLTLRRLGASPETVTSDVAVSGFLVDYGELSLTVGDSGTLYIQRPYEGAFELQRFMAEDLGTEALDIAFDAHPPEG